MEKLLTPIKLANGVQLENRFVLSPMTTNSSTKDGIITKEDLDYALRRAKSAPLQVTGAAYVDVDGQLFEFGFGAHDDSCIPGLTKMASAMQDAGAKAILQLTYSGAGANYYGMNHKVYGPSKLKLHLPFEHEVEELSHEMIDVIKQKYKDATRRAISAGFAGIEISTAQKLMLQTFFSTVSNKRHDEYGVDSLENRARFILEVFEAVYEVIKNEAPKDFILGYRATPEETRGAIIGYTVEEFNQLTDWILERVPLSYIAIASWGQNIYLNKVRAEGPNEGRLINEVVHEHLAGRVPLMATGGINSIEKSREAIMHAEMVGLSSVFVAEPDFVAKFQENREEDINLDVGVEDIERLAIPKAAFKDIVLMMDYGKSLPQHTRDEFRKLEENY